MENQTSIQGTRLQAIAHNFKSDLHWYVSKIVVAYGLAKSINPEMSTQRLVLLYGDTLPILRPATFWLNVLVNEGLNEKQIRHFQELCSTWATALNKKLNIHIEV